MTLGEWVENSVKRFGRDGAATGVYGAVQELYEGGLGKIGEHIYNYGTPVWEKEWDVLVVLDTCRPDLLAEVSEEYDFLSGYNPERDRINSVGSRSPEWIRKTFDPDEHGEELEKTAYVSANPHTRDIPDPDALYLIDEVWKYAWDVNWGNVPPENLTDRAVAIGRKHDAERLIVHYMQPHAPYRTFVQEHPEWYSLTVGMDNPDDRPEMNMWERLRTGRLTVDETWRAYRDTLRWVLNSGVAPLLENIDGTVAVTSDHGEGFGDWWYYGHSTPAPIPPLKRVPWATTEASDSGELDPEIEPEATRLSDREVEDRLAALGYR
ncbi:hypothetical protein J2744_000418 [Halorubrum trapanicum]|uniref:Sulfatase n=1 Tax=Halorubrum trapanicum TaxID=29284 RepID=A0A8J7UMF0_9EURY|nr:hypothetical protein [Halorubrum trapanicum]MBP1900766.1 hypothetical protein [Halorubrum trapanicum]